MYLSGTSMSASPIPIFGSPCSGPDCSSVIRALKLGLDRLRQVGFYLLSSDYLCRLYAPIIEPELVILFSLLSKALRFH